jgi:hypothetical protein
MDDVVASRSEAAEITQITARCQYSWQGKSRIRCLGAQVDSTFRRMKLKLDTSMTEIKYSYLSKVWRFCYRIPKLDERMVMIRYSVDLGSLSKAAVIYNFGAFIHQRLNEITSKSIQWILSQIS